MALTLIFLFSYQLAMYQVSCFYHKMHDSSQNCYISAPLTGKIPNMSEFYLSYYKFWFDLSILLGNIAKFKHQNKGTCSYIHISEVPEQFQLQNIVGNRRRIF